MTVTLWRKQYLYRGHPPTVVIKIIYLKEGSDGLNSWYAGWDTLVKRKKNTFFFKLSTEIQDCLLLPSHLSYHNTVIVHTLWGDHLQKEKVGLEYLSCFFHFSDIPGLHILSNSIQVVTCSTQTLSMDFRNNEHMCLDSVYHSGGVLLMLGYYQMSLSMSFTIWKLRWKLRFFFLFALFLFALSQSCEGQPCFSRNK